MFLRGHVAGFTFKRPGACHHARFMAKAIYSTKMALLSQLLDSNDKIKRVVSETAEFFSIFYGPWFLKSAVPQRGPGNECQIIELMKGYQELKPGVAQAVLHAMQGQACYLTPSFLSHGYHR